MDELERALGFTELPAAPRITEAQLREMDASRKDRLAVVLGAVCAVLYALVLAAAAIYCAVVFPQTRQLLLLAFSAMPLMGLALCVVILAPGRTGWAHTLMGG